MSGQDRLVEKIVAFAELNQELSTSLSSENKSAETLEILKEKYHQEGVTEADLREARRVLLQQKTPVTAEEAESEDAQATISSASTSLYLRVKLQRGLVRVIKQIDQGYTHVMWMYTFTFVLGIVLVLTAVFASLILKENVAALVSLGGAGMMTIISALIFRPIRELQNSRGNLAQLQGIFINWVNDLHNWNLYLSASASDSRRPLEEIDRISDKLFENTELMMWLVGEYTELQGGRVREGRDRPPRRGRSRTEPRELSVGGHDEPGDSVAVDRDYSASPPATNDSRTSETGSQTTKGE